MLLVQVLHLTGKGSKAVDTRLSEEESGGQTLASSVLKEGKGTVLCLTLLEEMTLETLLVFDSRWPSCLGNKSWVGDPERREEFSNGKPVSKVWSWRTREKDHYGQWEVTMTCWLTWKGMSPFLLNFQPRKASPKKTLACLHQMNEG